MEPITTYVLFLTLITPCDHAVERKIQQLGAERYSQRAVATKELRSMEWKAIPWLKVYSNCNDIEIAQRSSCLVNEYFKEPEKFPWFSPPGEAPIDWGKDIWDGPRFPERSGCFPYSYYNPIGNRSREAREMTRDWYRLSLNMGISREILKKNLEDMSKQEEISRKKILEDMNYPPDFQIDESYHECED